MIETLKWQVRSLEQSGRHQWLTRAATLGWTTLQNFRDWQTFGRFETRLAKGQFPSDIRCAVEAVCEKSFGSSIRPMQDTRELTCLIQEVAELKPRRVLEIGTARGGTLFLLCRFAAPDATIVSVYLPYGRNGGGYPRWKERHYQNFTTQDQSLHLIRANSHARETVDTVRDLCESGSFDFILIDADHSYDGVKQDYRNYRPLLSKGGLLALHDVLPNTKDPSIDVARFWLELENDPNVVTNTIIADRSQGMYGIGLVRG